MADVDQTELKVEVMRLNEQGRPEPTGEYESLEADSVILALGQKTDTAFLQKVPGVSFETNGTVRLARGLTSMT